MHFKHVDAIEMDAENYGALENNVQVYGLKNVDLHHGDSTKLYKWHSDVLYIDAPWGGPSYKEHAELDLYLGTQRVDTWLASVLKKKWRPAFVFLKLPRNYKFDRLVGLPNVSDIHHVQIRGYDLIGLEIE
jgi:predicted RNA methylase